MPGIWCGLLCRVSQRNSPKTISAAPITIRNQDAQPGGLPPTAPSRPDTPTNNAVSAAIPISHPARNIRPVGRGRGVCSTRTAGMIDNGDRATTSASGMSSVSSEIQPVVTLGCPGAWVLLVSR